MRSVEEQSRFLLRAWPIPDRAERGDEIVGTTLDLVPGSQKRLTIALAVNLVVGGLRARWRLRPPLWRWLYYRLGGRLATRWHRWMLNDLNGPGWRRRITVNKLVLNFVAIVTAAIVVHTQFPHGDPFVLLAPLAGGLAAILVRYRSLTRKDRDRQLVRHGYCQVSQNYPPWPPPHSKSSGPRAVR
jgi:hypothetical protein